MWLLIPHACAVDSTSYLFKVKLRLAFYMIATIKGLVITDITTSTKTIIDHIILSLIG